MTLDYNFLSSALLLIMDAIRQNRRAVVKVVGSRRATVLSFSLTYAVSFVRLIELGS